MSQTHVLPISAHLAPPAVTQRQKHYASRKTPILTRIAAGAVAGLAAGYVMNLFQSLATAAFENDGSADKPNNEQGAQKQKKQPNAEEPGTPMQNRPATVIAADKLVRNVTGDELPAEDEAVAGKTMHYLMSFTSGALFGLIDRDAEHTRALQGLEFGAGLWVVADEVTVPVLGLSKPPEEYPAHVHLTSLLAHLVFGTTTALVRRLLVRALS